MWISGRRAVRPDRDYYRSVRRVGLRSSRGGQGRLAVIVPVVAVVLIGVIWLLFR